MKLKYKYLMMAGVLATAFTACSDKDDTIEPGTVVEPGNRGEETVVELRISQSVPGTYASTVDDPATANESKITTQKVHVYVFDDAQAFEKYEVLDIQSNGSSANGGDRYSTGEMTVSSGDKYFYVFANVDNNPIPTPASTATRATFEKSILNKTVTDLTGSSKDMFLMGTLYGQKATLTGDGVTGTPETVTVSIGRLSAKVTLVQPANPVKGDGIAGIFDFTGTQYRIMNVPTSMYLVGQWSNGFRTQASQVTTPYFYEDLSTVGQQNAYFQPNPTTWSSSAIAPGTPVYTLENTNEEPRKGTATAIQVRYKYAPATSEIYDVNNPETAGAALVNGATFWMATFTDGTKLIYNDNPSAVTHSTLGNVTDAQEYTDGYVYYTIYVADNSETTAQSLKYAVIRNHSYKIVVNTISRLGNSTPDIDKPTEPVEVNNVIDFDITVDPWYLIDQAVDL